MNKQQLASKLSQSRKLSRIPLSKDQRKQYRKKLEDKLNALGLKDESILIQTGKYKQSLTVRDGKVAVVKVPLVRASNPHRNLIKKLLKLSVNEVERFLNTDFNKKEILDEAEQE